MPKECLKAGCTYHRFGGGYCKMHQWCRDDKKPSQLKRTALKTPTKPIKKVSIKRTKQNAAYLKKRTAFLDGKLCPITGNKATEIHHTNGRENERLLDEEFWLAVTRAGHQYIHANPQWARDNGYLI